jgi:hypothetical protein
VQNISEDGGQIHLWTFRRVDRRTGEAVYLQPTELDALEEFVALNKLEGDFCLCVVMPSHSSRVDVSFDRGESPLIGAAAAEYVDSQLASDPQGVLEAIMEPGELDEATGESTSELGPGDEVANGQGSPLRDSS